MKEEIINHVSHKEHPLKLVKVGDYDDEDDINEENKTILCDFCKQMILYGSVAYCCNECHYFMHKTCAELEPVIINDHEFHCQHPLKLTVVGSGAIGGDDEKEKRTIICVFCKQYMSNGSVAYACYKCDNYLMHNTCAKVGRRINHHLHPRHPLIRNYIRYFECDICDDQFFMSSAHSCRVCQWYVCAKCVVEEVALKEEKIDHPEHHLALRLSKPVSFPCDACRTDDKDLLYQCTDCLFSIHKTCATLAPKICLPHHYPHPLILSYQLPERFIHEYTYYCEFCKRKIRQSNYVYHCPRCRYFAHIKCALNALRHANVGTSHEQANDYDGVVHFPMAETLTQPLKLLRHVNNEASYDNDGAVVTAKKEGIYHWSHPHHLLSIPIGGSNVQLHTNTILVCNGCVRPISIPYYRCDNDGCQFFLHKYCAELSRTLEKHPLHPSHSLHLLDLPQSPAASYYRCKCCSVRGNSFVYGCEACKFYLDVNCAFLPNTIKHESHNHPLLIQYTAEIIYMCDACKDYMRGVYYVCKEVGCTGFRLDRLCALKAPRTSAHRYCKGHTVPLRYPPIDHHADFYCDICEKKMHPKSWMYYCDKCDNCFHIKCLEHEDGFGNCIIEGIITCASYHNHPLTFARRKNTPSYVCFHCNKDINNHLILECHTGTCPFTICTTCHVLVNYNIVGTITHVPYHEHPLRFAQRDFWETCSSCYEVPYDQTLKCSTPTCSFQVCTTCHLLRNAK